MKVELKEVEYCGHSCMMFFHLPVTFNKSEFGKTKYVKFGVPALLIWLVEMTPLIAKIKIPCFATFMFQL